MRTQLYSIEMDPTLSPCPVRVGLIWAEGIRPPVPTTQVPSFLVPLLESTRDQGENAVPAEVRQRVRAMLRHGRYKPSGRSKPASEFLLRAALDQSFPLVNAPVDVNNAISLESGFPGSIFDADLSGPSLQVRRGTEGETYVFNPSGQSIDLQDLLLVCRRTNAGWEPCGNPVKDAMVTKISTQTSKVVAVLYVPATEPDSSVATWTRRYADLLTAACGAERSGYEIVPAAS